MITLYVYKGKEIFELTEILESVTWSGDYKQCCRKLEFSFITNSFNISSPSVAVNCGNLVKLYQDKTELFRGFIYTINKTATSNSITCVAYDYGVKLKDIKVSYNVKNKTASEMCNKIITKFSLTKGNIAEVKTKVSKVFIGTTIYDMIMSMYTLASKVDGNKYMIDYRQGKFNVIKKGTIRLQVAFEESKNLLEAAYSESIEKVVNKVLIVDEAGNVKDEVKNSTDVNLYGLFQDVIKIEKDKNPVTEATSKLQGIEKTCSLQGYGDTTCTTGYAVTVKDSKTGLVGLFYIDSDIHKWEGSDYSISLGLNFKNLMNEVEAGEDENKNATTGGTTVSGGREVDAEFTAYYPANDSMQGGFIAANGERLRPSELTCAAPKDVAFGTKIQVKNTNTSRDSLVYRCNDRGSAIKVVNGIYHIDLLMATKSEAYAFGRRRGKAVIGVEVLSYGSDGTSSDKARKAVEFANSKVGNSYVWGATGPNSFDCSGLTMTAYKQSGISIPRTSQAQSTFGKAVSKDQLQTGDLLFFSTNGSGRVSHVGIYEGNGVFIHASSPKNGIKKNRVTESYYVKAWKGARRVV